MRLAKLRRLTCISGTAAPVAGSIAFLGAVNALAAGLTASAAAPWIILIEGERPGTRAVFSDWEINLKLMLAVTRHAAVDSRSLVSRPSLRVALFWGPEWQYWRKAGIDPDTLPFEPANQHARLYQATRTEPPVWVFASSPLVSRNLVRSIDSRGVALLISRGVLVRAL